MDAKRIDRAASLLARISNMPVTVDDVRRVDACERGIREWLDDHGLDTNASVPLSFLAHDTWVMARYVAFKLAVRVIGG